MLRYLRYDMFSLLMEHRLVTLLVTVERTNGHSAIALRANIALRNKTYLDEIRYDTVD